MSKGQQAVQILADIVGQKVIEPTVAGTLIVRKLNEMFANQTHLGWVLCGVAFDHGRLVAALEDVTLDNEGAGEHPFRQLLALPLADMREQSAPIPQPGRIIHA